MHLNFTINKEILDSVDYTTKKKEKLKEYNDINVLNSYEFMNDLFQVVLKKKSDWVNMEYDETSGKGNATINLTLLDGQEMDSKQLNSILATIDEKIKEYEFNSIDEDSKNDIDNIDFEDDGIFIFFFKNDNEDTEVINFLDIENKFTKKGINFNRVSLKSKQDENGVGNTVVKLLYFLANTIASGILWDKIKEIFDGKIKFEGLDSTYFRKLRKDIAELTGIDEKSLVVKEFHTSGENMEFIFESNNVTINVKTNENYKVIDHEVN